MELGQSFIFQNLLLSRTQVLCSLVRFHLCQKKEKLLLNLRQTDLGMSLKKCGINFQRSEIILNGLAYSLVGG
nr:MAG TPA: hypothetical protein [Caudoviricetes sp.]